MKHKRALPICSLIDTPANELTTDAFVDEALAVAKHLGAGILTTVIKVR